MSGPWSLRTTAEANLVPSQQAAPQTNQPEAINAQSAINYGFTVFQDISYDFQSPASPYTLPLSLKFRLQFFDAREWNNRIYAYEHDVLYAYSSPAVYGLGGRAYISLRWRIIPQLSLYFRFSETLYDPAWYSAKHPSWSPNANPHQPLPSRTDIHLLLRATL